MVEEAIKTLTEKRSHFILIVSALAVGGLTYLYLGYKSNQADRAVDEAVEIIAKETKQRPKSEADLQKKNAVDRNIASINQSEFEQQQSKVTSFGKSKFNDSSVLLAQVAKLAMEILKSDLPMETKSALNAELHELTSKKMAQLSPSKVVDTKLDLKDNIVYPVFETK